MAHDFRNWLVHRIHDHALYEACSRLFRGRLIDIGCRTKPYAKMMRPFVDEHVGVDHQDCRHAPDCIDLYGSAYRIPAENQSFDCALCTAVLEHLEEPEAALAECFRVLKPGGTAVYSVPFIWHVHEAPRDFFRFSRFGLHHVFRKAGFERVEVRPLSGFWVTFGIMLSYSIGRFHRGPLRFVPIIPVLAFLIQVLAYGLERLDRPTQWTWMYLVVAQKPESINNAGRDPTRHAARGTRHAALAA